MSIAAGFCPLPFSNVGVFARLISVEDDGNYFTHIIHIVLFLLLYKVFINCRTPYSNIFVQGRYKSIREASEHYCESITPWTDKCL